MKPRQWGVRGSAEPAARKARLLVVQALAETDKFPPADEARRLVVDRGAFKSLTSLDRLKVALASRRDGDYRQGSPLVAVFVELTDPTIREMMELIERNPPPTLVGMMKAMGPRRS